VEPDEIARVIVNEGTGTVVVGECVSLLPVAIAHENLSIEINTTPVISQPEPFLKGETLVVPETEARVADARSHLVTVQAASNNVANAPKPRRRDRVCAKNHLRFWMSFTILMDCFTTH